MFESAELGHKIDKKTYDKETPSLRAELLNTQYDVKQAARFSVVVVVNGIDGAGKGETVNLLNEWMDPRHIETHAFPMPSEEELERPPMWRYWRALPPKGKIGILFGSWYSAPISQRVRGEIKQAELDQCIEEIQRFEKMLADEGVLVIKFWFHLTREAQKARLKSLEKDPKTRWRVTTEDWRHYQDYGKYRKVAEHMLRHTSTGQAPWVVIDGSDERYRALTVGKLLVEAMKKRLAWVSDTQRRVYAAPLHQELDKRNLINQLDLGKSLSKKKFQGELERWQGRLSLLCRDPRFRKRSLITLMEGPDAAGKGGSIRRITGALDARQYQITPIAAPTEEERAQPYLWRFWRRLPRWGGVAIFDRSWYGRVLVERVEGFCSEADWMRAYAEINDFEEQLVRHGSIVVKFWLAISKEEQLKRFQEREQTQFKRFKITEEDWRNREKWDAYQYAVCDMIDRSSTEIAPWVLIEANDKYHARIKVLRTLCEQLENMLDNGKIDP